MNPYRLHKVSWVVASILNEVSQEDLVDWDVLDGPSEERRKQQLDRVRKWCAEHAAATHANRLVPIVEEAREWQDVQSAFWALLELDEGRALDLIVSRCDREVGRQHELARLLCLLDRKEYLPRARQWMQERPERTRFWGALLVLRHADPRNPEGLDIVLVHLARRIEARDDEAEDLMDVAIETLTRIDDPRVRTFLSTWCGETPHRDFHPSSATLQQLFLAGNPAALNRLLYYLNDRTPAYEGSKKPRSDNWLWWLSLWRYKNPPSRLYEPSDEQREEAYADLKQWLAAQFRVIQDGRTSDVIKEDRQLPWGDWKTYSSGWVKRL
jgi:hypothetical protein